MADTTKSEEIAHCRHCALRHFCEIRSYHKDTSCSRFRKDLEWLQDSEDAEDRVVPIVKDKPTMIKRGLNNF